MIIAEREFFTTRVLLIALLLIPAMYGMAQVPGKMNKTGQVLLPNGWKLSPAGRSVPTGDLPLNIQLSASGKLLAVTNNGQSTQSVQLFDPKSEKLLDEKELKRSWYGLAFSRDERHLYVSGGYDNSVLDLSIQNGKIGKADTIRLALPFPKAKVCPTGLVATRNNGRLYVVTKEDSSLYVIDPTAHKVAKKIQLPGIAYSCILSPDEKTLYISLWGMARVAVYNTITNSIGRTINTGDHPNELLLNKKGSVLFVANAN